MPAADLSFYTNMAMGDPYWDFSSQELPALLDERRRRLAELESSADLLLQLEKELKSARNIAPLSSAQSETESRKGGRNGKNRRGIRNACLQRPHNARTAAVGDL